MADEFDVRGYLRVAQALTGAQVARFSEAVDQHLKGFPNEWVELSDSFREGTNVLPHTADFDEAIENPKTLDILRAIIGDEITFEEFAIMLRSPTRILSEVKGWHRDIVREYDRRMEVDAVSVLIYLTDVTDPSLPPQFYAKWKVTNILEGVGKRPADIDSNLPLSEVIKEVQRRGRTRM